MKTTFKSVALFVVVLGISAVGLSGTASAARGSGSKMGSGRDSQTSRTPSRNPGNRLPESHKTDSHKYDRDRDRYGRYGYPYCSSYWFPGWYPCYEPRYCTPAFCFVPPPVVEECLPPPCPPPVVEECPPCPPYYAACGDYCYPGCYDKYWKDHDKWKDRDPKHGRNGKDAPPRLHPLTESQHATASGNLGKTTTKVAGNFRGGHR